MPYRKTNISVITATMLTGSLVFLSACLDRIELEIDTGGVVNIAVDSKLIYGNPSLLNVTLSEVFDFDGSNRLIVARSVELIADTGESVTINKPQNGLYAITLPGPQTDMTIESDKTYKLSILLASGDQIETNFQNINRVPAENKLIYNTYSEPFENDEGQIVDRIGINFLTETTLPTDSDVKIKWEFVRTFKFSEFNLIGRPFNLSGNPINDRSLQCDDPNYDLCRAIRNDPENILTIKDCDLDGFTNAIECDKNTDPRDASDYPSGENKGELRSCYLTGFTDIQNVKIFDPVGKPIEGTVFQQDLFQPKIDFKFSEGYFIRLITESLNKETFDYFEKIETILNLSGSMFDPPAAKVTGNFVNITNPDLDVYGQFYVTERDTTSVYISPSLVGNPDTVCLADFMGMPPDYCLNCTLWERDLDFEGILPPDFWATE